MFHPNLIKDELRDGLTLCRVRVNYETLPASSEATAMTDCNHQPLRFSTLANRAVVADFSGGRLTTDAGALLLREVAEKTGLFEALDAAIPDPRNPVFIIHDQRAL